MTNKTSIIKVGDRVHFMLENEHEIKGKVVYTGLYYKQIDPNTDKPIAKFGYSDKILDRMIKNKNILVKTSNNYKVFLDDEIYMVVGNAIEVEFDTPLYYNGIEMSNWTFKESHILNNTIEN
ncbi:hypothetical protein D3C87_77530 [compost metagenome]